MKTHVKIGLAIVFLTVVGVYFLNPFGTATWDPRARIVGWVPYRAQSAAMAPTVVPGDHVLVQAFAYMWRDPHAGDIVVFYPPGSPQARIFRIVGAPGDTVRIESGRLHRNGVVVEEAFNSAAWRMPYAITMPELTVPKGQYFLLGDNRDNANDSRIWGTIGGDAIVGRVFGIWNADGWTTL